MPLQAVTQQLNLEAAWKQACSLTSLTSAATVIGNPVQLHAICLHATSATRVRNTMLELLANQHCKQPCAADDTSGLGARSQGVEIASGMSDRLHLTRCHVNVSISLLAGSLLEVSSILDAAMRVQDLNVMLPDDRKNGGLWSCPVTSKV